MILQGERIISAPPAVVWERLLAPEVLKACIPGCEALERIDGNAYSATAVIKVGPVKARFSGGVTLTDLDAPRACRLSGQGSGGVSGFAKGEANIVLEPTPEGTLLRYDAKIEIGGKIAALGDRLFRSVVNNNVDAFFNAVATGFGTNSNAA
jgi:carbon monoxide dehydrogenase subunit G